MPLGAITIGEHIGDREGKYIYLRNLSNSILNLSNKTGLTGLYAGLMLAGSKSENVRSMGSIPLIPCHPSGQKTAKAIELYVVVRTYSNVRTNNGSGQFPPEPEEPTF